MVIGWSKDLFCTSISGRNQVYHSAEMAALDRASAGVLSEHLRGSCPSIVKACAVLREFQQSNGYEPGAKAVRGAQMQWLIDVTGLAGICWIAYDVLAEDEVWSVPTGIRSAGHRQPRAGVRSEAAAQV